MKAYTLKLKGTKKNNTNDINMIIFGVRKSQAFNMAYTFFQKGDANVVYGTKETGLSTIHQWIPEIEKYRHLAGKYNVYRTSII